MSRKKFSPVLPVNCTLYFCNSLAISGLTGVVVKYFLPSRGALNSPCICDGLTTTFSICLSFRSSWNLL